MIFKINAKCNKGHEVVVYEIHFDLSGNFVFSSYCQECDNKFDVSFDYFTAILNKAKLKES